VLETQMELVNANVRDVIHADSQSSVLRDLDRESISKRSKAETRNREVHLPPIGTFRWWARRTEAVNGALIDAFSTVSQAERITVCDPFAGGGTIALAGVMRGQQVYAQDINPWAAEGLSAMLSLPKPGELRDAAIALHSSVRGLLERAYGTSLSDGRAGQVAHTYRVATGHCSKCQEPRRLFPYATLTLLKRKERGQTEAYLACPEGHIQMGHVDVCEPCLTCGRTINPSALYTPGRNSTCHACGHTERLSDIAAGSGLGWEVVLVQRVCGGEREFGLPTEAELEQAEGLWKDADLPDLGLIPPGRETSVLRRHGYQHWNDLYPRRQQAVLQSLLGRLDTVEASEPAKRALRAAVVGSVEFAGHLCRWDRWYLKCNDATAAHRFNFTTFAPEPNVWGAGSVGRGTVTRRLKGLERATRWLHAVTGHDLAVAGPLTPGAEAGPFTEDVRIVEGSSESMLLADGSVHLVLTDPPYHDDVQYDELSLLFRVWSGLSAAPLADEATSNAVTGHNADYSEYGALLRRIFLECRRVLRGDGRLMFSYANRDPRAWLAVFEALEESGFHAVGYTTLHSENERDYSKRGVKACTQDMILELSPTVVQGRGWAPAEQPDGEEEEYLRAIGRLFLDIGRAGKPWRRNFLDVLASQAFLQTE